MTLPQSRSCLFIYENEPDFSNGWIYHHWALCGQYAALGIWGL